MKNMVESKIEKAIEDIRVYIDECKTVPFAPSKIMVSKEEIDELLDELEASAPEEIKRSREIVAKYDEIINEAESQAKKRIDDAGQEINKMLSENEILLQAYAHADEVVANAAQHGQAIIDSAAVEANTLRDSAVTYMDEMLQNMENLIESTIKSNDMKFKDMQDNLEHFRQIIVNNRQELCSAAESNNAGEVPNGQTGAMPVSSISATGEINLDMI